MTVILAIDPGNERSAFVFFDGAVNRFGIYPNEEMVALLHKTNPAYVPTLVVEMIASYGMPVGAEVFETCVWIGRFIQAWGGPYTLVYRKDVKLHLCGQPRAKDANIRQALLDRFGGKQAAIGNKASPGPLYGVKADVWSALAVAVTYADGAARSPL